MASNNFMVRIFDMNRTFEIQSSEEPTDLGLERLEQFKDILQEEMSEIDDIIELSADDEMSDEALSQARLIALADLLGDIVVYATSEARRWGIPIMKVLHAIMDSQESKLVDGKPLKDDRDKFVKGPNYVPPEPMIAKLLFG